MKKKNRGKEEKKRKEYAKPRTRRKRLSYWKIGLTTMAAIQELVSGIPLVLLLIRLWNSILPEPGQPSAQLSKLICLTECRKTQHSMSRWHRTVHIPWLDDSYDTHKGNVGWILIPKPQGTKQSKANSASHSVIRWWRSLSSDGYSKANSVSNSVIRWWRSL